MKDIIDRQEAVIAINTWEKFGVDERGRVVRWHEGLEPYIHLRDVLTAILNLPAAQHEVTEEEVKEYCRKRCLCIVDCRFAQKYVPPVYPERKKMSSKEWVEFLSDQFDVSRTTARGMLHGLMRGKAEDNFKKQFSGGRK